MARTLENVFDRQMKKHFPDDDNQSSDEDFEEELTEKELRKLNKKKNSEANGANGMDDLIKAVDIHQSSKDNHMSDRRISDPNMFARHFEINPMSNGVARDMPCPRAFGAQRMPYVSQGQPLYGRQMFAGHLAFTRFNMNELARGSSPMFPAVMGIPHPGMAMRPPAPGQLSGQEMKMAVARGVTPVATKGKVSRRDTAAV